MSEESVQMLKEQTIVGNSIKKKNFARKSKEIACGIPEVIAVAFSRQLSKEFH